MWFSKKKDKDVFEYEVFAGVKNTCVDLNECVDMVVIYLYFKNSFYEMSKTTTIFMDTLESFKEGGENTYILEMSSEDFEEKFIIPTIKNEVSEIMGLKQESKEIEKIVKALNLKGKVSIKGCYSNETD